MMPLQEAIEEVKRATLVRKELSSDDIESANKRAREAIATILNAVVKGEVTLNVKGELK